MDPVELPAEERIERVINHAFGGWHHVKVKERTPKYARVNVCQDLSTHDWDLLTRLVVAAHTYGVRVEIAPCNMHFVSVWLHPRFTREGSLTDQHPDAHSLAERATSHHSEIAASMQLKGGA